MESAKTLKKNKNYILNYARAKQTPQIIARASCWESCLTRCHLHRLVINYWAPTAFCAESLNNYVHLPNLQLRVESLSRGQSLIQPPLGGGAAPPPPPPPHWAAQHSFFLRMTEDRRGPLALNKGSRQKLATGKRGRSGGRCILMTVCVSVYPSMSTPPETHC